MAATAQGPYFIRNHVPTAARQTVQRGMRLCAVLLAGPVTDEQPDFFSTSVNVAPEKCLIRFQHIQNVVIEKKVLPDPITHLVG